MGIVAFFRHLFIPHHSNNHRAKALHIDALLTYLLVFAILNLGLTFGYRKAPEVLGYATDIRVEQIFTGINKERVAAGLEPLTLSSTLSAAAAAKAADMFAKNYWAHNSPTGATPWDFMIRAGYNYSIAGENLAKNFSDSQSVVSAWMASASHRANILKPGYREVGYAAVNGVLNGEETTLVVQFFGTQPVIAAAPSAPPKPVAVLPTAAAQTNPQPEQIPAVKPVSAAAPDYQRVTLTPAVNIPTVSRSIVFAFVGILMGLLLVDALIAGRRHVVRIAGHNVAHLMFLTAIYILLTGVGRGRLL